MTKALEIRVLYLLTEFPAHTSVVLRPLQTAGAIASRALQALFRTLREKKESKAEKQNA